MSLFSRIRRLLHKPTPHTEPKPEPRQESPRRSTVHSNSRTGGSCVVKPTTLPAEHRGTLFITPPAAAAPAAYKKEAIKKRPLRLGLL